MNDSNRPRPRAQILASSPYLATTLAEIESLLGSVPGIVRASCLPLKAKGKPNLPAKQAGEQKPKSQDGGEN